MSNRDPYSDSTRQSEFSLATCWTFMLGLLCLTACGGSTQGSPPPPPPPAAAVIALPSNADAADPSNLANNIWTIKSDGSSASELTTYAGDANVTAQALQPLWSPDGSKMLFVSDGAFDGTNNLAQFYYLWIMNSDGSGRKPFYANNPAVYNAVGNVADWSHSGTKVAVSAAWGNGYEIVIVNSDGSNPTSLVTGALAAVWSPDDTKLVFEGGGNIWTIHADGSALTQLTNYQQNSVLAADAPVWSPDGKKIAFNVANQQSGGYTIWTMNADGSNQQSYPGSSFFYDRMVGRVVNWSPDGSKLTFHSTAALDGNSNSPDVSALNIWVMNADGSGRKALTQYSNNVNVYVPTWSPDGLKIAFLSSGALDGSNASGTGWCIWVVNADGSGLKPMSATATGLGWNTYWLQPAWKPK